MDRLVAMTIGFAVHVGSAAWSMPYEEIGAKTGCSEATAIRAIKRLEGAGWLGVQRTGGRRANTFSLNLPSPLAFPDEETRQMADVDETKAANLRGSNPDKKLETGKFADFQPVKNGSLETDKSLRSSARVDDGHEDANPCTTLQGLDAAEHLQSCARDAERQPLQIEVSTLAELCDPKRIKEYIPYSPLPAQPENNKPLSRRSRARGGPPSSGDLQAAAPPMLVFVKHGTTAAMAWERDWLRTKRKRPPWQCIPSQGFKRGWFFPSEFPPKDTT